LNLRDGFCARVNRKENEEQKQVSGIKKFEWLHLSKLSVGSLGEKEKGVATFKEENGGGPVLEGIITSGKRIEGDRRGNPKKWG